MILFFCNDDPASWQSVQNQAGPVFGNVYQFIQANTPALGQNENLFIVAHGTPGEIGNQGGSLGYNALDIWNVLTNTTPNDSGHSLFPANYQGNIYIWTCFGNNITRQDRLSFAENLHAFVRAALRNTSVYATYGPAPIVVAPPGDAAYVQIANTNLVAQ